MAAGATLCVTCRAEGLQPDPSAIPASRTEWDGVSYPSFRLHRPTEIPPDRYDALLRVILGPAPEHSTAGEAA
jgi:hypothetical protein